MSPRDVPDDEAAVEAADDLLAGQGESIGSLEDAEAGTPAVEFRAAEDAVEESALD